MFGLARRKAHQEAKTPPPLTLPAPTPAPTYPASTAFATPTPAPTTPFSATTLAALANPLQQHNQQQYNNNFQLQQQRYNNIEQQQQVYSTYSAYGAAPASAATLHSQLPQPHQNYPYPSHSLERDSRSRDKIGRAQQEDEEEKEELLERQIQELSGILGEDNRSKRTRRNPHSPPNSHSNLHSHNPLSRSSSLSSIKGASVSTSRSVPPPSHAHASNTPISQRSKVYTPGPSYTPYSP
ncbi:hypothetical protein B484DRAFT_245024 [Ochromonadaceae sp. CCMP2298]|nr:hypothetical protein B484DRAFT_245024 [Ochromonadaceae sp. CCMP2298]